MYIELIVVLGWLYLLAISLTLSDNGIFNKAVAGRDNYQLSANRERAELANAEAYVNESVNY